MKRKVFYRWGIALLVLIVGYSLCGCRSPRDERDRLRRAEMLMDSLPAVSLSLLDSVSSARLRGNDVPLYALLKSQADYRNEIPFTTDSLILLAAQHYGTHRKSTRAALSQYYLGCAYKNLGRDTDAIDALLRATYLFPDTTSRYYALSYFELGRLYIEHSINDKSVEVLKKYKESSDCSAHPNFSAVTDYYLGWAYMLRNEIDKADSIFLRLTTNDNLPNDYRADSYYELAKMSYYEKHETDQAAEYLLHVRRYFKDRFDSTGAYCSLLADIFAERQSNDSAFYYYKKALEDPESPYVYCHASRCLIETSLLLNECDSIHQYLKMYEASRDSIEAYENKLKIYEIEGKHAHDIEKREIELRNLRTKVLYGSMSVFAFVLCAFALLLADRKRKVEIIQFQKQLNDIKQQQIDSYVIEESYSDDMDYGKKSCGAVNENIETHCTNTEQDLLFHEKHFMLLRQRFEESEWKRIIISHRADIVSSKKMPQERREKFVHYLDELFVDVFLFMSKENPKLTKNDLEYCAMAILQFDFAEMAYCTSATVHSYHCRRGRMKEKLTDEWYRLIYDKSK